MAVDLDYDQLDHFEPHKRTKGRRGTYFNDPDGHLMEILTPGGAGS